MHVAAGLIAPVKFTACRGCCFPLQAQGITLKIYRFISNSLSIFFSTGIDFPHIEQTISIVFMICISTSFSVIVQSPDQSGISCRDLRDISSRLLLGFQRNLGRLGKHA